jgi:beta-fructofuranosidase
MALMLRPWAFLLFLALVSYDESGLQSTRNGVAQATQRVFLYPQSPKVSSIVSTKYRTAYHFQPPKNWINGMSLCSSFLAC